MEALQILKPFGNVPVTHQNLVAALKGYSRPNDKIRDWVKKQYLVPLARGIYAVSADITGSRPSPFLMANILYGPSYVSLEYALAYYGAIPEAVHVVTSVTTKRSREVTTPYGRFTYTHLPQHYYTHGIRPEAIATDRYALMASPEKALCDLLVGTRHLVLRSKKDVRAWFEDMRLDTDWLLHLDTGLLNTLLKDAPKRESLRLLVKTLQQYAERMDT